MKVLKIVLLVIFICCLRIVKRKQSGIYVEGMSIIRRENMNKQLMNTNG